MKNRAWQEIQRLTAAGLSILHHTAKGWGVFPQIRLRLLLCCRGDGPGPPLDWGRGRRDTSGRDCKGLEQFLQLLPVILDDTSLVSTTRPSSHAHALQRGFEQAGTVTPAQHR